MVKNVEVELECNKGWLRMHYSFQLVSLMLYNLASNCVSFTNPHVFLVLLVRETKIEVVGQSF
jgi:hypothetical protein